MTFFHKNLLTTLALFLCSFSSFANTMMHKDLGISLSPNYSALIFKPYNNAMVLFDFDDTLTENTEEIIDRFDEHFGGWTQEKFHQESFWSQLTDADAAVLFDNTEKTYIVDFMKYAVGKNAFVAVNTNNSNKHMIRAYLKYFLGPLERKVPIVYLKKGDGIDEGKNHHIFASYLFFQRFGHINKVLLLDNEGDNLSQAYKVHGFLPVAIDTIQPGEAFMDGLYADGHLTSQELDFQALEKIQRIKYFWECQVAKP